MSHLSVEEQMGILVRCTRSVSIASITDRSSFNQCVSCCLHTASSSPFQGKWEYLKYTQQLSHVFLDQGQRFKLTTSTVLTISAIERHEWNSATRLSRLQRCLEVSHVVRSGVMCSGRSYLDLTVDKQLLHSLPVSLMQACVMHADPKSQR